MRTICTVVALVAFAFALTAADTKFDSKDGRYSAKFPGEPKVLPQKAGGIDVVITIFQKSDKIGYSVIYSDVPADVVKGTAPAKLLETGEKGLADTFKAKITKSGETKFMSGGKQYPAREITAEREDINLRVLLVMADSRLYQVYVVGPKEAVTSPEADEFFKSFEVK